MKIDFENIERTTERKFERCLEFRYYDTEKAHALENALKQAQIDYVAYYDGLYILFKVTRSNRRWDEIKQLINSIKAPKYRFVNACIINGQEYSRPITIWE